MSPAAQLACWSQPLTFHLKRNKSQPVNWQANQKQMLPKANISIWTNSEQLGQTFSVLWSLWVIVRHSVEWYWWSIDSTALFDIKFNFGIKDLLIVTFPIHAKDKKAPCGFQWKGRMGEGWIILNDCCFPLYWGVRLSQIRVCWCYLSGWGAG